MKIVTKLNILKISNKEKELKSGVQSMKANIKTGRSMEVCLKFADRSTYRS